MFYFLLRFLYSFSAAVTAQHTILIMPKITPVSTQSDIYINPSMILNSISLPNFFGKYSKKMKTKKPLRCLERLLGVPKAGLEPARLLKDIGF